MRKISDDKIRHIHTLLEKRIGQAEIASMVGVSVGKVNAIAKEWRAAVPPVPPSAEALDTSDAGLEGVELSTVDTWLKRIEQAAEAARLKSDFQAMSTLMAKYVALLEHKRKAAPPPPPDPNANPDFIEAARRARERMHHQITTG